MNGLTKSKVYDVLIVGAGVAGTYAALNLPDDVNILVLSKYEKTTCSSNLAQGGVAAVLDFEDDSFDLHYADTLTAGRNANNTEAVTMLVHEGPDDVRKIISWGVQFDINEKGKLSKTLEGGHSRRRIVHHKDTTGAEMVRVLQQKCEDAENIELVENAVLVSLNPVRSGFRAELLINGEPHCVFSSFCILATGGIGRIYKYTTNPKSATGDGIRIAYECGARIKNLEYIQFHPTAFNSDDGEQFLISESVRGEGAYLLNCHKERFMDRYDPRLELAPRDVVSMSIILESRRTGSNNFYLDITHKDEEFLKNRFPGIRAGCLKKGIDIAKDLIPVFPCQHYLMGGIEVDADSKTNVPRLYACGECSNTGVHGRNRLASNSLLEALVFSRHAAEDIIRCMSSGIFPSVPEHPYTLDYSGAPLPANIREDIKNLMQRAYFVVPDEGRMRVAKQQIEAILMRLKGGKYAKTVEYCEALSMATCAYIILNNA
ncbi:MAG TPA: FAD-binding protein [Clostridiales bacterium]|nr:FAD-binding protein [Clostridiales bacterium]